MTKSIFNSMTLFLLFIFSVCIFLYTVFHINFKTEFIKTNYKQSLPQSKMQAQSKTQALSLPQPKLKAQSQTSEIKNSFTLNKNSLSKIKVKNINVKVK
jgi:hypothetical protein